jgi:hypothetical protein
VSWSTGEGSFCISRTEVIQDDAKARVVWRIRLEERGLEPLKLSLCWSPGKDCLSTSRTKHNIKTAPRPKLFMSAARLQKRRLKLRRNVLVSSAGEGVFCSLKTEKGPMTRVVCFG